jgi:hypothetical protein
MVSPPTVCPISAYEAFREDRNPCGDLAGYLGSGCAGLRIHLNFNGADQRSRVAPLFPSARSRFDRNSPVWTIHGRRVVSVKWYALACMVASRFRMLAPRALALYHDEEGKMIQPRRQSRLKAKGK